MLGCSPKIGRTGDHQNHKCYEGARTFRVVHGGRNGSIEKFFRCLRFLTGKLPIWPYFFCCLLHSQSSQNYEFHNDFLLFTPQKKQNFLNRRLLRLEMVAELTAIH